MIAKIAIESSLLAGNEIEERAKLIEIEKLIQEILYYNNITRLLYQIRVLLYVNNKQKNFEIDNKPYMLSAYIIIRLRQIKQKIYRPFY